MTSFGLKANEIWSAEVCSSSREILGVQPVTSDLQTEKKLWELKGLLSHFDSKNKIYTLDPGPINGMRYRKSSFQVIYSTFGKELSTCGMERQESLSLSIPSRFIIKTDG